MRMLHLPASVERTVPETYARQLRDLDPNLICYFNPIKQRWVIDRCTRDGPMKTVLHEHTPECPRTNVTVVQDDGQHMPLCQQVLDDLKAKDSWRFGSVEEYERQAEAAFAEYEAKRDRQVDAIFRNASKDNRRQLLKAYDLTQIHDVARVNQ